MEVQEQVEFLMDFSPNTDLSEFVQTIKQFMIMMKAGIK
jgi:hypothetical protein